MFKSVLPAPALLSDSAPALLEATGVGRRRSIRLALTLDLVTVVAAALAVRLMVMALTANTYDYDEFVLLLLAREFAHGSIPYSSFMFFHPPGALVILRAIEPATALWWPLARIGTVAVDVATTALVWRIGVMLWDRRAGLAAGLLYAASPVALITSVRVGQDPLLTFAGILGLYVLLWRRTRWSAIGAGFCLACAVWIKYPGAYFLPVFIAAAPRRSIYMLPSALIAFAALMLPFHAEWSEIYRQTVTFQFTRWSMPLEARVQTTLLFWLAFSPFAVDSLAIWLWRHSIPRLPIPFARLRRAGPRSPSESGWTSVSIPIWLVLAFLIGGLFAFTSQAYYHYFAVVAPAAALLGAPVAARLAAFLVRRIGALAGAVAIGLAIVAIAFGWGELIAVGGPNPLYVTAAHLSDVGPTVQRLRTTVRPPGAVLADRFEYAYLANVPAVPRYFWNIGPLVNAEELEKELPTTGAVVLSSGASSGFPPGFAEYLDRRYSSVDTSTTRIWLIDRPKS